MKHLSHLLALAFTMIAMSARDVLHAADSASQAKVKEETTETAQDAELLSFYGKVVAITTRTLTIVRSERKDAPKIKYTLDIHTQYVDGNEQTGIYAVRVGAWVGGSAKKTPEGHPVLLKLNVGVKQKAKP